MRIVSNHGTTMMLILLSLLTFPAQKYSVLSISYSLIFLDHFIVTVVFCIFSGLSVFSESVLLKTELKWMPLWLLVEQNACLICRTPRINTSPNYIYLLYKGNTLLTCVQFVVLLSPRSYSAVQLHSHFFPMSSQAGCGSGQPCSRGWQPCPEQGI